jgi:hypothetical protein
MAMAVAVTAPFELDGPRAVTHWPTARAEVEAEAVWRKVVDDVVTIVTVVAGGAEAADDAVRRRNVPDAGRLPGVIVMACACPEMVMVLPLTPVTSPKAVATVRGVDDVPVDPPVPLRNAAPPAPNPPAPANPANPPKRPAPLDPDAPAPGARVQLPEAGGALISTVVAVTVVGADPAPAGGVPVATTQSPAATEARSVSTVWVNDVEVVQVTVVCPLVGFWTSMLDAAVSTAATVPETPGGALGAPDEDTPDRAPAAAADEEAVAVDADPPQAARVRAPPATTAAPSMARRGCRRPRRPTGEPVRVDPGTPIRAPSPPRSHPNAATGRPSCCCIARSLVARITHPRPIAPAVPNTGTSVRHGGQPRALAPPR